MIKAIALLLAAAALSSCASVTPYRVADRAGLFAGGAVSGAIVGPIAGSAAIEPGDHTDVAILGGIAHVGTAIALCVISGPACAWYFGACGFLGGSVMVERGSW